MSNFRMPNLAVSPSDFWRRWHISLSQWLRDYLYVGLSGKRLGKLMTCRNLMLTMVLVGLWHGAGWTFLVWGAFHGLLLCGYRLFEGRGSKDQSARVFRVWIARLLMFHFVCIGWLFFRADSIEQAWDMIVLMSTSLSSITPFAISGVAMIALFAGPMPVYELWVEQGKDEFSLVKSHWLARGLTYSYFSLMLLFFLPPVTHDFIYFQF